MVLIHRRNLLDAARPELIITGWKRESKVDSTGHAYEVVTFAKIRNIGRGPAFNASVGSKLRLLGDHLVVGGPGKDVPVIAAGEEHAVNHCVQTFIHWERVKSGPRGIRAVDVQIRLRSVDGRRMQHSTEYLLDIHDESLWASMKPELPIVRLISFTDDVSTGIRLVQRHTTTRAMWQLWLAGHARTEWTKFIKRVRNTSANAPIASAPSSWRVIETPEFLRS
jgi:hypothetical protein